MSTARSRAPFASITARFLVLAAVLACLVTIASTSASAIIIVAKPPNFYSFTGGLFTGGLFNGGLQPGVDVSLNPQPLPPFPNPSTLNLTDPTDPMISEGGTGGFQLDFAMLLGNKSGPGTPLLLLPAVTTAFTGNTFHWIAGFADGSAQLFDVFVTLSAPGAITVTGVTDGTLNFLPAVQVNFDVQAAADPGVSFQVFDIGTQNAYSFAPTPEPGSLMLLGTGLAGMGLLRRKLRG